MARKLRVVPISEITPDAERLAAARSDTLTLDDISASLEVYGLIEPLVITKTGHLLCGHSRLAAAIACGWSEIECVVQPNERGENAHHRGRGRTEVENFARRHDSDWRDTLRAQHVRTRAEALRETRRESGSIAISKTDPSKNNGVGTSDGHDASVSRPRSVTRTAIREVAAADGVSEKTVARAVKSKAPEMLEKRKQKSTPPAASDRLPVRYDVTPERQAIYDLWHERLTKASSHIKSAGALLKALLDYDLGGGKQWQEALHLRNALDVLRAKIDKKIPHHPCDWCNASDSDAVRGCLSCDGTGWLGVSSPPRGDVMGGDVA